MDGTSPPGPDAGTRGAANAGPRGAGGKDTQTDDGRMGAGGGKAEVVEVDGLLLTFLPDGALALVDSHPDGATSMISLSGDRLEAVRTLLARPEAPPAAPPAAPTDAPPDPPPEPPPAARSDARPAPLAAPHPNGVPGVREDQRVADDERTVDWDLYDEQLRAAFLLEQYARGVAPQDLPPGWRDVLESLPAALARRSRRTRSPSDRD